MGLCLGSSFTWELPCLQSCIHLSPGLSLGPHTRCLGQFGLAFELGDWGQRDSFQKRFLY